jgi:hypothetical protein
MINAGYSGTPLVKKLGFVSPMSVWVVNAPMEYRSWLGELPAGVRLVKSAKPPIRAAHIFVTQFFELNARLSKLRNEIEQDGFVWVSWYKKSAKKKSNITEHLIREIALPLGFVDVKVCAVSDEWSGLKLVIRKSERH